MGERRSASQSYSVSALPPARPPVYRRVARGATVRRSRVLAASPSLLSHLMSPRVSKSSFLATTFRGGDVARILGAVRVTRRLPEAHYRRQRHGVHVTPCSNTPHVRNSR